jgi:5-methylcytosine-specific restriction endonuclease McrA
VNYPTETLNRTITVFSQNYLPISRINIRRAIILLVTGKAEALTSLTQEYWEVRSVNLILEVPTHIRLKDKSKERVWKVPPVNRREVLKRDKYQCQYCGTGDKLTLDHVIPKSKGGKHTWDNVVTACAKCNCFKGDRTPVQAGMVLKKLPTPPLHPSLVFAEQFWRHQNELGVEH